MYKCLSVWSAAHASAAGSIQKREPAGWAFSTCSAQNPMQLVSVWYLRSSPFESIFTDLRLHLLATLKNIPRHSPLFPAKTNNTFNRIPLLRPPVLHYALVVHGRRPATTATAAWAATATTAAVQSAAARRTVFTRAHSKARWSSILERATRTSQRDTRHKLWQVGYILSRM